MIYLIEAYRSTADGDDPDASGSAVAVAGQGAIRYLGALALPSDEVMFHLFDAASRQDLLAALATAGVRVDRVSEARDFGLTTGIHGELPDTVSATAALRSARIRRARRHCDGGGSR